MNAGNVAMGALERGQTSVNLLGHREFRYYSRCNRKLQSVLNKNLYPVVNYHLKRLLRLLCEVRCW